MLLKILMLVGLQQVLFHLLSLLPPRQRMIVRDAIVQMQKRCYRYYRVFKKFLILLEVCTILRNKPFGNHSKTPPTARRKKFTVGDLEWSKSSAAKIGRGETME
mmetsp:Transcript_10959/g.13192  ORF Transcript_10959/g.13192 Transcript_10959/m.13192 type:complete len:104 (-) Transcript_10959:128-439(-)